MKKAFFLTKMISIILIIYFAFKSEELNEIENYIKKINFVILFVIIIVELRLYFNSK